MGTRPMAVILIDDDPHVRDLFRLVMDHYSLSAEIFDNSEAAIDYLRNHTADVVVIDIVMPELDGYELLERIQKANLAPRCRFVATTAYYTNDTQSEVLAHGFNGYLPKPFSAQNLVPYLRTIVENQKPS